MISNHLIDIYILWLLYRLQCPPGVDPKWRFFWRIGERPKVTKYATLAAEPVVPKNFPEWTPVSCVWCYCAALNTYTHEPTHAHAHINVSAVLCWYAHLSVHSSVPH